MLSDPDCLGNVPPDAAESMFDPQFWRARNELQDVTAGRGSAWFIVSGGRQWALRHYRRGGFIARLSPDRYVWAGEGQVRAFAEWRLLDLLRRRGLPVPRPVAARYQRAGLCYRCDLITERIVDAQPLSSALAAGALAEAAWRAVGAAVARLHQAGVDHADLNAHNILIEAGGAVSVIDFDRGRLRSVGGTAGADGAAGVDEARGAGGSDGAAASNGAGTLSAWAARNLGRLQRSLAKISRGLPRDRYLARDWQWFMAGYRAAASGAAAGGGGGEAA
jgi:3-deoxy-D-manno-octulosonic acid kinase